MHGSRRCARLLVSLLLIPLLLIPLLLIPLLLIPLLLIPLLLIPLLIPLLLLLILRLLIALLRLSLGWGLWGWRGRAMDEWRPRLGDHLRLCETARRSTRYGPDVGFPTFSWLSSKGDELDAHSRCLAGLSRDSR